MEIDEQRPKGITIIAAVYLLTACINVYRGVFGENNLGYVLIGIGIFQIIVSALFYGLNKKAYYIVSAINILALFVSLFFLLKGVVQYFQSDVAVLEIILFLPSLAVSMWIFAYLRKFEIKALFQ
ncbi:MAG: hypothetical protein ABW101_00475 [Candidatus Thiodiazotropha sp.]